MTVEARAADHQFLGTLSACRDSCVASASLGPAGARDCGHARRSVPSWLAPADTKADGRVAECFWS